MSCPGAEFALHEEPFVSVLIPTFKRMDLLKEAIRSALGQEGYSNFEVVVSDNDPSEENTRNVGDLVASFGDSRLRYCPSAVNLGMTGNWNRCLELAQGELLTFLHDDDLLHPHFLRECVARMSGSDLIACRVAVGEMPHFDKKSTNPTREGLTKLDSSHYLFSNISPAPGVLFRRSRALELGGFDDAWYPCSDYDFWIRYCSAYPAVIFPRVLAFYRLAQNESQKTETRIQIAERAFALQTLHAERVMGPGMLSRLIPAVATGLLVATYARQPSFRKSEEFRQFYTHHKIAFPRSWLLARGAFVAVRGLFLVRRLLWA